MGVLHQLGQYLILLRQMLGRPEKFSMYWKETMRQMYSMGVGSVGIILIISLFIGAVSAVQYAYQLQDSIVPSYYIGYIVRDSLILEFAPNITAIVLAGKVGSNIASELGGMRQKEQIDALEIMGVNTAGYLILPKLISALVIVPLLTVIAAFIGITGGYFATIAGGMITGPEYMTGLLAFHKSSNVVLMLVKAITFGFLITTIASFFGYYAKGGSIELGQASTKSVVLIDILIVVFDYIISLTMMQ